MQPQHLPRLAVYFNWSGQHTNCSFLLRGRYFEGTQSYLRKTEFPLWSFVGSEHMKSSMWICRYAEGSRCLKLCWYATVLLKWVYFCTNAGRNVQFIVQWKNKNIEVCSPPTLALQAHNLFHSRHQHFWYLSWPFSPLTTPSIAWHSPNIQMPTWCFFPDRKALTGRWDEAPARWEKNAPRRFWLTAAR